MTATAHAAVMLYLAAHAVPAPADPAAGHVAPPVRGYTAVRLAVAPESRVTLTLDDDVVRVPRPVRDGRGVVASVTTRGHRARPVPGDSAHAAWRAVEAAVSAARAGGWAHGGVRVHVDKGFPGGAGLGAADADAAAALLATRALLDLPLTDERLRQVAVTMGPGVAAALDGGATLIRHGKRTTVMPVLARGPLHLVLALHTQPLGEAEALAIHDRLASAMGPRRFPAVAGEPPADLLRGLAAGDAAGIAAAMGNSLQPAVITARPGVRRLLAAGAEAGALAAQVSATGTAVVFVCKSAESAAEVAVAAGGVGLTLDVLTATAPAGPATLG